MPSSLEDWLPTVNGKGWVWFAKVLAANDTKANPTSHQSGVYVPKWAAFKLFPDLEQKVDENPDYLFPLTVDSHGVPEVTARMTWYNKSKDETRITRMGKTPVRDPDSTGSVCVFAFQKQARDVFGCRVWLCRNRSEEETIFGWIGPVEPGGGVLFDWYRGNLGIDSLDKSCRLTEGTMPSKWRKVFPTTAQIVELALTHLPSVRSLPVDQRILRRRACESEMFFSVEELLVLPRIKEGFGSIEIFTAYANSILNRRKSRSGKSLELQLKTIFDEESLRHSYNKPTEGRKRPDFIFPSIDEYHSSSFPREKLMMLGVKTTMKDRWRQILSEAKEIPSKHLFTLQEGLSDGQMNEVLSENVQLVVPRGLFKRYKKEFQPSLLSLEQFVGRAAALQR